MKITLIIEVPGSADWRQLDTDLRKAAIKRTGITITTGNGHATDVDLLLMEGGL